MSAPELQAMKNYEINFTQVHSTKSLKPPQKITSIKNGCIQLPNGNVFMVHIRDRSSGGQFSLETHEKLVKMVVKLLEQSEADFNVSHFDLAHTKILSDGIYIGDMVGASITTKTTTYKRENTDTFKQIKEVADKQFAQAPKIAQKKDIEQSDPKDYIIKELEFEILAKLLKEGKYNAAQFLTAKAENLAKQIDARVKSSKLSVPESREIIAKLSELLQHMKKYTIPLKTLEKVFEHKDPTIQSIFLQNYREYLTTKELFRWLIDIVKNLNQPGNNSPSEVKAKVKPLLDFVVDWLKDEQVNQEEHKTDREVNVLIRQFFIFVEINPPYDVRIQKSIEKLMPPIPK